MLSGERPASPLNPSKIGLDRLSNVRQDRVDLAAEEHDRGNREDRDQGQNERVSDRPWPRCRDARLDVQPIA